MVYQEDVAKTAVALAGFSHADADGLRKIMSKKDKSRKLDHYKERFIAGAQERGVADKQIRAVWDMMMSFSGRHVRIAGLLITGKVVHTKHGEPMEFLTFEDETGLVETTFFPKAYRRFCAILDRNRPFILYGKVEEDFGAVTMTIERVDCIQRFC